jgi:hypothetical protein
LKKAVGVLIAMMVASIFGFAGTAAASRWGASAPAATSKASSVSITDPVANAAAKDPDTFAVTVAAVEPYLVVDSAGNLRLDVPAQVASGLDAQSYAALQHSVQVYNDLNEGVTNRVSADASIPSVIWKFISKYWSEIVAFAKKSGKWAWYKAAQCAAGAANALYKTYGGDLPGIVAEIKAAIVLAGVGCVANL